MIRLIQGAYASFFPVEIDAMFRSRADTFWRRLGCEVVVENGCERDGFDDLDPLYLVSVDPDTEAYRGSLRLLPTTGPNMLRDVFPQLLDGPRVASPTIWEASRMCAIARDDRPRPRGGETQVLVEFVLGIGEVAVLADSTEIVAVFDERMFRLLKAAGFEPRVIGTPKDIGGVMSYAALFDVGLRPLATARKRAGIEGSILAPGATEWAFGWGDFRQRRPFRRADRPAVLAAV